MKCLIEMKKIAILLILFGNYLDACHLCLGDDRVGFMDENFQNNTPPVVPNFEDNESYAKEMVEHWLKGLPNIYDAIPEVLFEDTIEK